MRAESEALVARAMEGDRVAEVEIVRRLQPAVSLFARRRLRGPAADELAQDALVLLLEALRGGRIEDPSRCASYALGICRNLARERARGEARRKELASKALPTETHTPAVEPALISRAHLEDCLSHVTERARDVLARTFVHDASDAEIADALALSPGNVRVIRHRTLSLLRECLERPMSWRTR